LVIASPGSIQKAVSGQEDSMMMNQMKKLRGMLAL